MPYTIRTAIPPGTTSGPDLADIAEEVGDLTQIVVLSDTTNQPASPSEGDAYIVNGDASWGGAQYDIAVFRDATWIYHTPEEGWVAYIKDRGEARRFNATDWNTRIPDSSPEHATDSGTDTFVSATNTDKPKAGDRIDRDFQSANTTTTPTLDGTTLTTKDGSALWPGALSGVHTLQLASDGNSWLVLDPVPQTDPGTDAVARLDTFTRGHIDGLELSNNGTDSDHDIDIATGVCSMRDGSGNRKLFELSSALTKQIDANWAEGTDAGGFPSGLTLSADTWYHVFVIGKDDGTVDAGFDTDTSASNLLSDASSYSWFRRIGSILTEGSSNVVSFLAHQSGRGVEFRKGNVNDYSSASNVSNQLVTLTTPSGIKVQPRLSVFVGGNASTDDEVDMASGESTLDRHTVAATYDSSTGGSDAMANSVAELWTNTSSQVRLWTHSNLDDCRIDSYGWFDPRID